MYEEDRPGPEARREDSASVEQAWVEEAERRYERYLAGNGQSIPAADAIARVRARIKSRTRG
jgi:hypothetical protein